jgi:hypothetical protein
MKTAFIVVGVISVLIFLVSVFVKWSKKKAKKNQELLDGDTVDIACELADAGLDLAIELGPVIAEKTLNVAAPVGEAIVEAIGSIDV